MKVLIKSSAQVPVQSAEAPKEDERLQDAISSLKDDFDFLLDGLDFLGRKGVNATNDAMSIAENIHSSIQSFVSQMADAMNSGGGEV